MTAHAELSAFTLDDHPAVRAWRELGAGSRGRVAVELRKRHKKSSVYRLVGAGLRGATVIAKQCPPETAAVERVVYEEILPKLDLGAVRCYGCVPERDGRCWLFLEDAGEGRISFHDTADRRLVASWFARLHVAAAGLPALERLPDRGPAHYAAQVQAGRLELAKETGDRLTTEHRRALRELASLYERLTAEWERVAAFGASLPPTLIHRDLRRGNVRTRGGRVLVLDWEMAGRGVVAVDVVRVDVRAYLDAVRTVWALDRETARRLRGLGGIFCNLDAVEWISVQLLQPWGRVDLMQLYAERLAEAMRLFFGKGKSLD